MGHESPSPSGPGCIEPQAAGPCKGVGSPPPDRSWVARVTSRRRPPTRPGRGPCPAPRGPGARCAGRPPGTAAPRARGPLAQARAEVEERLVVARGRAPPRAASARSPPACPALAAAITPRLLWARATPSSRSSAASKAWRAPRAVARHQVDGADVDQDLGVRRVELAGARAKVASASRAPADAGLRPCPSALSTSRSGVAAPRAAARGTSRPPGARPASVRYTARAPTLRRRAAAARPRAARAAIAARAAPARARGRRAAGRPAACPGRRAIASSHDRDRPVELGPRGRASPRPGSRASSSIRLLGSSVRGVALPCGAAPPAPRSRARAGARASPRSSSHAGARRRVARAQPVEPRAQPLSSCGREAARFARSPGSAARS